VSGCEECKTYFQEAIKESEKEVEARSNRRFDRIEKSVSDTVKKVDESVEKVNECAVTVAEVAAEFRDINRETHNTHHHFTEGLIKEKESKAAFRQALALSLASKGGLQIVLALCALLAGFLHWDTITEYMTNKFFKGD